MKKSAALYNVNGWGAGFFTVNDAGIVTPKGPTGPSLDINELVSDLVDRGLRAPFGFDFLILWKPE